MMERKTTKTIESILRIWYVLAEINARPVKLRNDAIVSRRAGPAKIIGFNLLIS